MKKILTLKGYSGILWVGDPHLWSRKPGSRLATEDFLSTVLGKIEQAVDIAIEHNLYLIFAGDLFDDDKEQDITLLTRLTRILSKAKKKLKNPVATVEGNHEKTQVKYTDSVATRLLQEADLLLTMEKNGLWAKFEMDNKNVYVGSTPYGEKIPDNITRPDDADSVMWLTHHNLGFGDNYPGIEPIKEIKGVDILINGHIHQLKKPIKKGDMVAFNPGNITRLSIDCIDHIPQVWKWTPENSKKLEPITLKYVEKVFKNRESAIILDEVTPQMSEQNLSSNQIRQVVQELQNLNANREEKSDDVAIMKAKIEIFGKAKNATPDMIDFLKSLVDKSRD